MERVQNDDSFLGNSACRMEQQFVNFTKLVSVTATVPLEAGKVIFPSPVLYPHAHPPDKPPLKMLTKV